MPMIIAITNIINRISVISLGFGVEDVVEAVLNLFIGLQREFSGTWPRLFLSP